VANIFDIIVIGAGPAGCMAAYTLARAGIKPLLLEKERFPRYKPCGGGLVERARKLIPFDISDTIERECPQINISLLGSNLSFKTIHTKSIISMIMRDSFDRLLAESARAAGTRIEYATKVHNLNMESDHVTVSCDKGIFRSGFVICATGAVNRLLKTNEFTDQRYLIPAIEYEVHVPFADFLKLKDTVRFDFDIIPSGYAWIFPKKEHLSIGLLNIGRGGKNLHHLMQAYLQRLNINHIESVERHGFMIPVSPRPALVYQNRILLVGDAAGVADPLTAEGISSAIQTGIAAARAIIDGAAEVQKVASAYKSHVYNTFHHELRISRFIARIFYHNPRLRTSLLRHHAANLTKAMIKIFDGEATYKSLVCTPANYLKLLTSK